MKFKIFMVFLLIAMFSAGCGKKDNEIQGNNRKTKTGAELGTEQKAETELETGADETEEGQGTEKEEAGSIQGMETEQEAGAEPTEEKEQESQANYQRESESGKVKFDCKIETPDSYTGDNVHKYLVSGECYGDEGSILSRYVEGKEVAEKFSTEAHDGIPGSDSYNMADGAVVNVGGSQFSFSTRNSNYYYNARALDSDYQEEYSKGKGQVAFATAEEAIDDGTLDEIIYSYGGDEDVEDIAVLILNKKDLKRFAKLRDKQGRKVYTIKNHGNTGTIDEVPYIINSACGEVGGTAGTYAMAYGPLSNYEVAIFSDIDAKKSEHYKFKQGQVAYRADVFMGGNVVAKNGFIRVKNPAAAK